MRGNGKRRGDRESGKRTEGRKGEMKRKKKEPRGSEIDGDAPRENEGAGGERSEQQVSPVARRKSIPNYAPAPLGAKRDKKRLDYIFV